VERFGLTEKQWAAIEKAISRFEGIEEVVLFGSRAMGNHKPGSDVDLAIKGKDVSLELSSLPNEELPLPHHFDVVHYGSLECESLLPRIAALGGVLVGGAGNEF
jgi:predicted nucleotidyltransferase